MIFKREPVLLMALIQAAIALGVSFGLKLSADQVGTIVAFMAAALSFIARTQITPLADPRTKNKEPADPVPQNSVTKKFVLR